MTSLNAENSSTDTAKIDHSALAFFSTESGDKLPTMNEALSEEIGRAFYKLGKLYYDKADLNKAFSYFEKALDLYQYPRDVFSVLKIYGFLIRIFSEKKESEQAQFYIKKAENEVEKLIGVLGSLNAEYFYNLGNVKNYSGQFEESIKNFELALKSAREGNEPELVAKCLYSIAVIAYNHNDYEKSLSNLDQLSELLMIINKDYLRGAMYHQYGKVFLELGEYDKALDYYKKANNILKDKKCWNLLGYILLGKGVVQKRAGKYAEALEFFELGLEVTDENIFKRLHEKLSSEIEDVNDSSVDIYLDRVNRKVKEKSLGIIDFKHRFVLLEILFLLARNAGESYDKEQLAKSIWKDEYNPLIHDKLIYTSVSRLRKLIEPKNNTNEKRMYIIRGKDGYSFNPHCKIRFHHEGRSFSDKAIGNVDLSAPV